MLTVFIIASLLACTEQKDPEPYSYTKIFTGVTSKVWKLSFVELAVNGKVVDVRTEPCLVDERYTFYSNEERLYSIDFGKVRCDGTEVITKISDSWSYNTSTTTLTMIMPYFINNPLVPLIVREARRDKMILEIFFDQENTVSYRFNFNVVTEN